MFLVVHVIEEERSCTKDGNSSYFHCEGTVRHGTNPSLCYVITCDLTDSGSGVRYRERKGRLRNPQCIKLSAERGCSHLGAADATSFAVHIWVLLT
jgi:hypothetical protein